jgi:hypothetical protein
MVDAASSASGTLKAQRITKCDVRNLVIRLHCQDRSALTSAAGKHAYDHDAEETTP